MTDEEIKSILLMTYPDAKRLPSGWLDFARRIERRTVERAIAVSEANDDGTGYASSSTAELRALLEKP